MAGLAQPALKGRGPGAVTPGAAAFLQETPNTTSPRPPPPKLGRHDAPREGGVLGRGPAPCQPMKAGVPGLPANGSAVFPAHSTQVARWGSTCGLRVASTSAPYQPMGTGGPSPPANGRWGAPRCPRSPANTVPAPMPPPPPNGARGAAHVTRGAAAGHPEPAPAPWSSRRAVPPAPSFSRSAPSSSFPRLPGRAGRARCCRPPAAGASEGGGALPASRDAATAAAGTMAARAPRVRGRAALKGAGAGRSRDGGGHLNQEHTQRQRQHSPKSTLFRFPPIYD